jgi:hypothetical protein
MDIYIKRIQTRASRQGVRASKPAIRELYTKFVANPALPTEVEMSLVLGELLNQAQSTELATTEPETIEITLDSQPPTEETVEETPAIAPQTKQSALTTTGETKPTTTTDSPALSQNQIQIAVEEHFGKESAEIRGAILNYVAKDSFKTATELQTALEQLRQMNLDILMKIVLDHNQQSSEDRNRIQEALLNATQQREVESKDFFTQFENQLAGMRAAFGL